MGRSPLKVTFMKRKKNLQKKIFELSTLCDVEACMVCFGPNGELHTWPENSKETEAIIKRYKNLSKEEQQKRKLDLSNYFKAKREKMEEELDQMRKENSNLVYPTWDDRLEELSEESLRELRSFLESKLVKMRERVELFKVNQSNVPITEWGNSSTDVSWAFANSLLTPMIYQPPPLRTILPSPALLHTSQPGLVFQSQTD